MSRDMPEGYYWVRSHWGGRLAIAHCAEFGWTFCGNDQVTSFDRLFGPENDDYQTYDLIGPVVKP